MDPDSVFYPSSYENLSISDKNEMWIRRANLIKNLSGRSATLYNLLEARYGKSNTYTKKMKKNTEHLDIVKQHLTHIQNSEYPIGTDNPLSAINPIFYQDSKVVKFTRETPLLKQIFPGEKKHFTKYRDAIDDALYNLILWRITKAHPASVGRVIITLQDMRNTADVLVNKLT
jgi:hypothetical protein